MASKKKATSKIGLKSYKLKVVNPFYDLENDGVKRLRNEDFETSEKRAKELLAHKNLVEILEIKK